MATTYFDIETEPADGDTLKAFEPEFSAPGNLKDPGKIAAAIAEKRAEWYERAALSPLTGRILAIGYRTGDESEWAGVGEGSTEHSLIADFFGRVTACAMGASGRLAGFSIHSFDLPFIVRRALALNIPIPQGLLPSGTARFYWPPWLLDVRNVWGLGEMQPSGSLDVVARFLGVGQKLGEGRDFARLYHDPATHQQAIDYLVNDLRITAAVGARLGIA